MIRDEARRGYWIHSLLRKRWVFLKDDEMPNRTQRPLEWCIIHASEHCPLKEET